MFEQIRCTVERPWRDVIVAVLLVIASTPVIARVVAVDAPANAQLAAFFEREYQLWLREHPDEATSAGVNDFNDRLTDLSVGAITRRRAHHAAIIAALERFDPKKLSAQDVISRQLMLGDERQKESVNALYGPLPFDGIGDWLPVTPSSSPVQSLVSLSKAMPFVTVRDYDNYLKRLATFPTYLEQSAALMRVGMRSGWMPPRAIMARIPSQFDAFVGDDVTTNPLHRPFEQFGDGISVADRERLELEARRIIAQAVTPAIVAFRRFIVDEYIPACTETLAASALPGGERYYALALEDSTTTPMTATAIHETGRREVDRLGRQMDALIATLGFHGTRAAFFERMRADPQFYYTKSDDMLRDYRDIAKRVDAELPRLFVTLPRLPYGVRAMEAYEGDNAEHYTAGALDGSRAGFFEANVVSLATRPRYDMENTFLHEAVPGHHLQVARAGELQGLPKFRRQATYTAYIEGWALYAESLGPTLGLYQDPYSRLASTAWDMVRACRLVIDTGLHAFDWKRDQAIAYMMDNAGLQRDFAVAEIDRYIAQPGQAVSYKIGQLKIVSMRDHARDVLGDRFDIRTFHNAVLDDGALPLTVLEQRIDRWLATQRPPAAVSKSPAD